MNKLEEARLIINKVDEQMRVLFEERMKASEMVAEYKKENNLPIFDEKREKEIISKQASLINPILKDEYLEFYTSLITISKKYQDKKINGWFLSHFYSSSISINSTRTLSTRTPSTERIVTFKFLKVKLSFSFGKSSNTSVHHPPTVS